MVEAEHLPNAPIKEAVLDIQCSPDEVDFEDFDLEIDGYFSEPLNRLEVTVSADGLRTERDKLGIRYENKTAGQVVLMKRDGLTFSKLAPYRDWDSFVSSATEHWHRFRNVAKVKEASVTRMAVRYINVFYVETGIQFQTYLRNAPETPDEENRPVVDEFLCRMAMPIPEIGGRAILITTVNAFEPVKTEGGMRWPLIYDIDVYKEFHDNKLESEEQMWFIFSQMRDIKNEMFFSVVTEEAKRLCR